MRNFLIAFCMLCLLACSKVTADRYEQVKQGMSLDQVVSILGEPSASRSINIAGISGTAATWKTKDAEITIQFLNDQVTIKTFVKAHPDKTDVPPDNY